MQYLQLSELIDKIDSPNKEKIKKIQEENNELFSKSKGSKTKHQAWEGGYIDHVTEVMNIALLIYEPLNSVWRRMNFKISDALLILYLHDIEKPFKQQGLFELEKNGVKNEDKIKEFKKNILQKYEINLTDEQQNALDYVEGEVHDYHPEKRLMGELATFCHVCDILSARMWHDYPKK